MGWEKISASTVGNFRTKFDLDTVAFRKGTSTFDNTKAMMVKEVGSCASTRILEC